MVFVRRKQVTNLTYVQQKDIQNIKAVIENYQCASCRNTENIKPAVTSAVMFLRLE